jgi:hypothetical protein
MSWRKVVPDAVFVRRVYLDLWGITPTPEQLRAFDGNRAKLVEQLLADRKMVTGHWISFWNDLLRDDLRAYHGGEKSIRPWLVKALNANMPVRPDGAGTGQPRRTGLAGGFPAGHQLARRRQRQPAADDSGGAEHGAGVSRVNLKCASCHDSFINHYKLKQAYGMAALFSEERELDLYRCDVKTGEKVGPQFLFPAVGPPVGENRRADAAALFTEPEERAAGQDLRQPDLGQAVRAGHCRAGG